jgi:7,8-dihydropterin-6-yl-methyl-4-(beta-D-ribofuranosyl)aminobenzene 5'-phosphate synthase
MRSFGRYTLLAATLLVVAASVAACAAVLRHRNGVRRADEQWQADRYPKLADFGSTRTLTILPLVNWHSADPRLRTEAGVSYLLRTDQHAILFDVGFNRDETEPSPLRHNMSTLGVAMADIDAVVLSHHHPDHAGGFDAIRDGTIAIGADMPHLDGKPLFSPVPLVYPSANVQVVREPRRLVDSVASIGPIARNLAVGWIEEQALAIHVEGKGIVLVVGCGHQTVDRILQRSRQVLDQPIWGIVGDLHFPVPHGHLEIAGLDVQRRLASGAGPLSPITMEDVREDVGRLRDLSLGVIALGGHDTHDEVLDLVASTFGPNYRPVRVGEPIEIGTPPRLAGVVSSGSEDAHVGTDVSEE